jgi:hypothetical protein
MHTPGLEASTVIAAEIDLLAIRRPRQFVTPVRVVAYLPGWNLRDW